MRKKVHAKNCPVLTNKTAQNEYKYQINSGSTDCPFCAMTTVTVSKTQALTEINKILKK